MKKSFYQKHLLAGTSVAAVAALSVVAMPSSAEAAWATLTSATTTQQAAAADGESLIVNSGGSVVVAGGNAAITTNKTGVSVVLNTGSNTTGIASTGGYSAVEASGTGQISNITVTQGTITSDAAAGATNTSTISIQGAAGTPTSVTTTASGTISNTGNNGTAINVATGSLTLSNAGNITSVGGATSQGINIVSLAGNGLTGTNTGNITASGTAINIGDDATINFVQAGGIIDGDIDTGASNTSTLSINGGTVQGNIALGNASQTLTLGGGSVSGNITGSATVNVTQDYTTLGNVILESSSTISVADGRSLTIGAGKTASAMTIRVGSTATGATLNIGQGSVVAGAIDAGTPSSSIINYTGTGTNTVAGNIGATNGFAAINIASGTVTAGTNTIKANYINFQNASSTLTLGTGQVTGTITANTAGQGTVNFTGNQINNAVIGGPRSVGLVTVANGVTATQNANIAATSVTVGGGTSGVLVLNTGKSITGAVNIANGGTFTQQTGATVNGLINGTSTGTGTYNVVASGSSSAFATNGAVGSTNSLAAVNIGTGVTATLGHNISASTITIGTAGGATATLNAGTTLAGNVALDGGTIFNIAGGTITGNVDGAAASEGTVNINGNFTSSGTLGAANGLLNLNVASGTTLTLGNNVAATTTTILGSGVINANNANRTFTGAVVASNTATLRTGTGTTTISGNFTTGASSTVNVTVFGNTTNQAGRLVVGGTASMATGTTINLSAANVAGYTASGTTYLVATGTSVGANTLSVVDNSAVIDYTLTQAANTVTAVANRTNTYQSLATGGNAKNVGTVLEAIGVTANAEVTALQARLDSASSASAVEDILDETTPQVQSSSIQAIQSVGQSLDVTSARLSNLRAGLDNSVTGMAAGNAVSDRGIWFQAFGMTAEQGQRNGVNGFDVDTFGMAVGADTVVADYTRAGVSLSYANTSLDSADTAAVKNTDIDSYQVNLYGSHDMGQWYTDGLLGYSWQQFDSARNIGANTAAADYDGQTYTARLNAGYRYEAGNGIQLIPNAGFTYFNNQIDGYSETGAGGLNLTVGDSDSQALFGRVGVDLASNFQHSGMIIRPVVRAAYLYDFLADEAETTALFAAGGSSFRVADAQSARNSFNLGASLNVMNAGNVTFSADYDYLTREDYDAHAGMLRARFGF